MTQSRTVTVVVPAHDEIASLPTLLDALVGSGLPDSVELLVVANGCTDGTAERARDYPGVRVVEISEASKTAALTEGDRQASHGNRAYVDADVVLSQPDLLRLVDALSTEVLAVAPERVLERRHVSALVSAYYDVWERLPQVQNGLFGRGVVVVSEVGHRRISALPSMMSDDLVMSEAFAPEERQVVAGTSVLIRLPRTLPDLLRRRVRVAMGNAEADQQGMRTPAAKTSIPVLVRLTGRSPGLAPKVPVFLGVTLVARIRARRQARAGDRTWLRDESSRTH